MKNFTLLFFLCGVFIIVEAQPTIPSSSVFFNNLEGNTFRINWTPGNGARRIVVMRQGGAVTAVPVNGVDYNSNVMFGSGDAILPGQFVVYDNAGFFVDVSGLQPNTVYHVAIFEYNGTASATLYLTSSFAFSSQSTLTAPTIQASGISFSNIVGNGMTLTWTNGNGARRIVVARQGNPVNANPVDLTSYNGSPSFGAGPQIGVGNFVVFSSIGNTVTVTGLQPNTTYHYSVFEQNGTNGPVYLIPGVVANATTLARPTVAASVVNFSFLEGNSMRINWTNGNGARRIIVGRVTNPVTAVPTDGVDYNASAVFGSGDAIQPGEFVVYDNSATFSDISNLLPNTVYHFRIYEYDGSGVTTAYLTSSFAVSSQSTQAAPTIQSSNINFTSLSGTTVTVNWANGNGGRRLVVARAGSAVNADPVNLTSYSPGTFFGSGTQIGTLNYAVFSQAGNSVAVTNLQPNTTYHFAVYEYNGLNGPVYLVPGAVANVTTPAQPTVPASSVNFNLIDGGSYRVNWTSGNGIRRIVVAKAGSAVTAVPVDGIDYNSNTIFGSGDAILAGEFVVYDNTSNFVDITGLQPATTYHFRIYEYNGSGVTTAYLTSSFGSGSQATVSPPLTQASAVNFTNTGGSTTRINWTNGNGAGRLVLLRQGSAVNANPVNLISYNGITTFGNGTEIGTGNFTVFRSTTGANNVTVTNLIPNTTYHTAVYEYNGINGPAFLVPGATGNITTAPQPTVAPSNMTFNFVEGNSLRINWTNGNGARRIVVARAGSSVTAVPANGTDYNANVLFGSGDAILPGQFVVFDGTSTFVDLSNLLPNTTYHFAVFEYDGTLTNIAYLTSSFLAGSQSSIITPTIQASNISFSSVAGTSVTVGWTAGNGSNRIVVARQSNPVNADPVNLQSYGANANFGSGSQLGVGNFIVFSSFGSSVNLTNLVSGTTYYFAVYEYNGNGGRVYLLPGATGNITTLGPPQTPATAVSAGITTSTSMQLSWTNGSGNRRLVLMKQTTAVDANPVDNATYNANSGFGSGTQLGTGNFVVFNGTSNTVLVTNLLPNTTYHFAVFEFNAFGANSQFLITTPARGNAATNSAVPLTFIDFRLKKVNNETELKWITANEQNTSHFDAERSNDGRIFTSIGTVASRNTSGTHEYTFADRHPVKGVNYYRLKQVDIDGRFEFSRIARINWEKNYTVVISPNPATNYIIVYGAEQFRQMSITDMNGKMVKHIRHLSPAQRIDVSKLASGVYFIRLIRDDEIVTEKFIRQ